ncbi:MULTISPECIES: hypothetical protein [Pimelobacter]|uniref:DUF7489 domain-containing protein n=1 Tax=Pimelobacter TaxID=2044 RepID=UPI001C05A70F|nr:MULTISPECIES: hypothetical protein [Pimelobacter]MBU2693795.1 hypothetical protein [Pimelobacter sp. 30-1]UUW90660.1 hypothetical protein M0M43_03990 [Pimelobacter simplex]UUW94489.1 hypothetical protein M0M48_22495 [Pimelobacter simplex]
MTEAWEGVVVKKSRGLYDGANMYRRLKVRTTGGAIVKARVDKDVWNAVEVGDAVRRDADGTVAKA